MKYMFQLMIILTVSFAGELMNYLLPFAVPASVYGLVLMFLLLLTGIVKLDQVEDTARFLMSIMPLFFIEPTVSFMNTLGLVEGKVAALFIASFLSFAAVLGITGITAQMIRKHSGRKEDKTDGSE